MYEIIDKQDRFAGKCNGYGVVWMTDRSEKWTSQEREGFIIANFVKFTIAVYFLLSLHLSLIVFLSLYCTYTSLNMRSSTRNPMFFSTVSRETVASLLFSTSFPFLRNLLCYPNAFLHQFAIIRIP